MNLSSVHPDINGFGSVIQLLIAKNCVVLIEKEMFKMARIYEAHRCYAVDGVMCRPEMTHSPADNEHGIRTTVDKNNFCITSLLR